MALLAAAISLKERCFARCLFLSERQSAGKYVFYEHCVLHETMASRHNHLYVHLFMCNVPPICISAGNSIEESSWHQNKGVHEARNGELEWNFVRHFCESRLTRLRALSLVSSRALSIISKVSSRLIFPADLVSVLTPNGVEKTGILDPVLEMPVDRSTGKNGVPS